MLKIILQYAVLAGALVFGAAWLKAMCNDAGIYNADLFRELLKHSAATVGLPLAAVAALCIVILLEIVSG